MLDVATLREALGKTFGPPRPQAISQSGLCNLRQRIRSRSIAPAKFEIRTPRSS
jgi:hypothetical protein